MKQPVPSQVSVSNETARTDRPTPLQTAIEERLRIKCRALGIDMPLLAKGNDLDADVALRELLGRIMNEAALSARERDVLARRFVWDETLERIGKRWGVSRERIRQVESASLRKLRHAAWTVLGGDQAAPTETEPAVSEPVRAGC